MKSKPKAKAKPKKTSHASNEVNNGHPEGSLEFCRKKLVLSLIQTLYHIYTFYVKFVAIRFLEAWPIGPIGLYFMWAWVVQCWKLSHLFTMLTIFDNFHNSDNCFCHFDNWKDNPGDLWHLRHWLQFWQLRTQFFVTWQLRVTLDSISNSCNVYILLSYLTLQSSKILSHCSDGDGGSSPQSPKMSSQP